MNEDWKKLAEHYAHSLDLERTYNRKLDIAKTKVELIRKIEKKREWKTDCAFIITEEEWEKLKKGV